MSKTPVPRDKNMTKTYGATQELHQCPLPLHLSMEKGGWLAPSLLWIHPLGKGLSSERGPAGSWCCWGVQSRLHGVGNELTPTWTFLLVEKNIIFVALQPLGVYSMCSNKGSSAVQGTRIYSNALKRRCPSSQSRAALAEGFPALWHTNCPNGGSSALPCAPTPPAVPWRWRNWGECKKALECLSSIPRCSVALLHVLIVNSQHQLIIEKVDVLRAKFGIAEARKF